MTLLPVFLPEGSSTKVSVNDKLTAGQVIAEKKDSASEEIIHLSEDLKISPKNLKKYLKKNLGDGLEKGNVIAVKKNVLGIGGKKAISKFSGTIIKIDEEKGDIYIKTSVGEKGDLIISPVEGTVDFCDNEKIVIKTEKDVVLAEDGLGEEGTGILLYIENFDPNKLTSEIGERVILTKEIDKFSLFKSIGLSANGIIVCNIENTDFIDLSEKNIKTPIMIMSKENFDKLEKYNNKKILLGGKSKSIIIL